MGMCGTCGIIGGLLVLLGGVSFIAGYYGWAMGGLVGGVLFALYGLAMLYHQMGMCDSCKAAWKSKK